MCRSLLIAASRSTALIACLSLVSACAGTSSATNAPSPVGSAPPAGSPVATQSPIGSLPPAGPTASILPAPSAQPSSTVTPSPEPTPAPTVTPGPRPTPGPAVTPGPSSGPAEPFIAWRPPGFDSGGEIMSGVLRWDPASGCTWVVGDDRQRLRFHVLWPHGTTARGGARLRLFDDSGRRIAQEGDYIRVGGDFSSPTVERCAGDVEWWATDVTNESD